MWRGRSGGRRGFCPSGRRGSLRGFSLGPSGVGFAGYSVDTTYGVGTSLGVGRRGSGIDTGSAIRLS